MFQLIFNYQLPNYLSLLECCCLPVTGFSCNACSSFCCCKSFFCLFFLFFSFRFDNSCCWASMPPPEPTLPEFSTRDVSWLFRFKFTDLASLVKLKSLSLNELIESRWISSSFSICSSNVCLVDWLLLNGSSTSSPFCGRSSVVITGNDTDGILGGTKTCGWDRRLDVSVRGS